MANHIHLHLDKVTKDAGTSEGARKAAITRKQHGTLHGQKSRMLAGMLKKARFAGIPIST